MAVRPRGVRPEAPIVPPDVRLPPGEDAEREQQARRDERAGAVYARRPPPPCIGQRPRHRDEEPDVRDVGIAVRHALAAVVEEPEHRQQRAEVPEPADGRVRYAAGTGEDERGHTDDQRGRRRDAGDGERRPLEPRMRVPGGEVHRPQRQPHVSHRRDDRVREPHRGRDRIRHRGAAHVGDRDDRDDHHCDRHDDQGNLLGHGAPREPAERPVVQQQEHGR